ncbi:MAG: oligosaccharide flippase family protein, partial [Fervidobacterium sp.]
RLVKMAPSIVTAIGPVMMPRMSNIVSQGKTDEQKWYIKSVFDFVTYSSILIIVLIVSTMQDFVPLFFGSKFLKVKELTVISSPIILLISWGSFFSLQIQIPMKKEWYLTLSVTSGAIVNFTLNLILIPTYKSLGATIATVIAEFVVVSMQIIMIKKLVDVRELFKDIWKHFIAGGITLVALLIVSKIHLFAVVKIALELLVGVVLYIIFEHILKSKANNYIVGKFLEIVNRIFK